MKVAGIFILGVLALGASAQTLCPSFYTYYATTLSKTTCGPALASVALGLSTLIATPTLLTEKTFPEIITNATGQVVPTSLLCGYCGANYTALIDTLYGFGVVDNDPSCTLAAAGYELVCVEDTANNEYCGDLDLQTVCTETTSCCVGALSSFLSAAADSDAAPDALKALKSLAGGFAYEFYCALRGYTLTSPDLDTCEFPDGTPVTDDYTWRVDSDFEECSLDTVTDYFDGLTPDTDGLSEYTQDEIDTCVDYLKAITSDLAGTLYAAGSDSVSFSYICESCTEIVDGLVSVLEGAGSSSDTGCFWASRLLVGGCYHDDDQYCGDYYVGGFPSSCTSTSTAGCCAVAGGKYLVDYLNDNSLSSLVEDFISDAQGFCPALTASQISNGISSCSLSSSLEAASTGAAAGITLRSIFTIVAASIALALMMLA